MAGHLSHGAIALTPALALANHNPILRGAAEIIDVEQGVDRERLRLNIRAAGVSARCAPCAPGIVSFDSLNRYL